MERHGFTLVELLIGLAISAILLTMSVPAMQQQLALMQLSKVLNGGLSQFRRAQALAVYSGNDVVVVVASGTNWCLATTTAVCNCQVSGDCISAGEIPALSYASHPNITLTENTLSPASHTQFTGGIGTNEGYAGTLTFKAYHLTGKLILSNLGRVRACIVEFQYGAYDKC